MKRCDICGELFPVGELRGFIRYPGRYVRNLACIRCIESYSHASRWGGSRVKGGSGSAKVVVDNAKCEGNAICVDVCPVGVFEMRGIPRRPGGMRSVATNSWGCILCRICEVNCPTQAITVTARKG